MFDCCPVVLLAVEFAVWLTVFSALWFCVEFCSCVPFGSQPQWCRPLPPGAACVCVES